MKHVFTFLLLLAFSVGYLSSAQAQRIPVPPLHRPARPVVTQQIPTGAARQSSPLATTIRYVKAGVSGTGASWSDASGDLQAMINASAPGDQVWIAGGTYKPSTTGLSDARSAAFSLKNGVIVLGGFTGVAGTEGTASARTAIPSSTTLSGDIGTAGNVSDNTYHVVNNYDNGLTNSTVLDGVAITGGYADGADGASGNGYGGGIYNNVSAPSIFNCQFSQNYALYGGAGVLVAYSQLDSPSQDGIRIINCSFQNNTSSFNTIVYGQDASKTVITNCFFGQNTSIDGQGGAFGSGSNLNYATSSSLTNCTFSGNTAHAIALINFPYSSTVNLTNCLLWNNGGQNAFLVESGSTLTASYCLIEAGETDYTNGGNNQTLTTSPFVNATGPQLLPCSPAVDAGNNAANATTTDVLGSNRKVRTIDIGAAEYQGSPTQPVTIASQSQSVTTACGTGQKGVFRVNYAGTGPYTITLFRDDTQLLQTSVPSGGGINISTTFSDVPLQSGTYRVAVTSACNSVTATYDPVTVNSLPTQYTVTGGGTYCAGSTGVAIGLSGSQQGVNYQLLRGGNLVTTVAGTGNPISFGAQTEAGTYTVQATNASTNCQQTQSGSVSVSINALPNQYNVTGGGSYCAGASGVAVGLSGSQTGVNYQLLRAGSLVTTVAGTGNALSFGNQTTAGTYTVEATNATTNCQQPMTGSVNVSITQLPNVNLSNNGPITCSSPTVSLSTTGGGTYSFSPGASQVSGGNTATVNQEGVYSVTVTTNGCSATATTTVTSNTLAPTATLGSSGTITCTNRSVILTAGGGGTYAFSSGANQVNGGNTATVASGGLYSVTVTGTNGCTATNTTTVESNTTAPSVSLINSGPIADNNPTVTLTAGGGSTYTFSPGVTPSGNTATVTTPGVYSVTATGANGCTGVASTTVAGAQNPATVCRNGTVVIRVTVTGTPVKYEWYKNTLNSPRLAEITNLQRGTATSSLTLTNQQVTANYYVRVTDQNGSAVVYGPFKVTVNMGCITALGRLAAEEVKLKINLLGNPLIGEQLRATISGAAGKALSVQLLDLSGKPVRSQHWPQAQSEQRIDWNLGGQASGVYLLQAVTETDGSTPVQRQSLKVIKP